MSGQNRNRTDILKPTFEPRPVASALGHATLHGPPPSSHLVVVLGTGPGLGLAVAQTFAKHGYATAILSRSLPRLEKWAEELHTLAVDARKQAPALGLDFGDSGDTNKPLSKAYACDVMSNESIRSAIAAIEAEWGPRGYSIGTAAYNASVRYRGPFLEQKGEKLQEAVQASIFAGFTFLQAVVSSMVKHNEGQGGTVIVTGATSSTRGREGFAGFAASKSGLRAVCQSVAREFGPKDSQNIHIAHVIVDGLIESDTAIKHFGMPEGSRFPDGAVLHPDEMAKTWLFLAQQQPSSWTFELDVRPAKEHF